MANNSNHIMSRYGKWIINKQKERLRKLYKGYRQSTAGDMRSQYLNAHKGMYGVRTTASAYGLGEGYVARKKAQMDSSLAEAGRQYAAQADAAFENNAVRPAANATIQAENERKQREYEEKLRKAREKAAKQAKAQADYEKALEEYNRNKDKTDKENAKRLAEYKKAMAKYRKDLKNAKQRGERLDRLPQRQVLHGGQPLPKGLSLAADLHQYEGTASTPKPLKPLPKGKGKGKGKGRGGVLSDQMYEYESGTGHQPIATSHQGLNNRPVAPKTNYAANQTAVQNRKKAKEAVVGKPTKPILAIDNTPIPVPPHVEKDLIAKAEAMKPEEIPQLKNDYINSAVEHENLVGDLYNALKPDMNRVGLAQEFNHWVGVAQNTALSPAERKQAAMYASRAAEEYNLQDNGKAHKERVATLMQMVNDSHEQLIQQQFLLQQKGVRMSEDEIGFDTGYLRQYGAIPAQASDATYAQAQALGDKNSDLGKQLRELTKMEYLHSQGLPSGQLSPQMQAFIEENNLGWLIDQEVLDRAPLVGIETAIEEKLKKGGDERTEYLQRKGIDRVQRELSTSDPEDIKRIVGDGDGVTHLKDALERGGDAFDKGNTTMMERVESYIQNNLGVPSDYINKNTINALRKDEASVAFIDYCYATGQADLAKQFLFDLTEAANKAAGEKQADIISNLLPDGWKWIPEFMYHLGYGASNAIWGKIDFFRGKTPTRTGAYTQEGIIQNEIERGWSEDKARNWANALTSAGENAADLGIGVLAGNALGAAGDAIGGTFGNIVGKVASHAPGISMGWSAAGSAKQEMLKKGYSEKAATIYGIFSGVSEAVLQEQVGGLVGFGDRGAFTKALSGLVNQIPNAAGRTAINAVLDVASEIGQEEFGNILDSVYRSVALGEGNDVYDDFKEQFNETAVTTAISTLLLNALHIPTQIRNERGYSAIADASGMSLNDARFLLETDAAIKNGEQVDPKDLSRYNELTAVLTAAMPENVAKAIADGKMTVTDWVTSVPGMQRGMVTQKIKGADTRVEEYDTTDHTEQYKALEGDNEALTKLLVTAKRTGKVGDAYYVTVDGKPIEISKLSTTEVANFILAQKTAKALKGSVDIVIHDTLPSDNGVMLADDGSIHVALDAMNSKGKAIIAYKTLVHEVGHALKVSNPGEWNRLKNQLYNAAKECKNGKGVALYDACTKAVAAVYNPETNPDLYDEELFCTVAQELTGGDETSSWRAFLKDETIFDMIAKDKGLTAKEKKTFLDKFKDSLSKMGKQFSKLGATKEERQFMKWHDSVMPDIERAYRSINENESLVERAAKNPGNKANIEAVRKQAEEDAEVSAIIKDLDAKDANIVAAIDGLSGEDLTDEQFRVLQRVIDKEEAEITPLGNPYNAEGVSPETMVEGTAVESQAQIPVKHSIKARNSIAQRTLETFHDHAENGKKRKGWKANNAITEDMLNAVYGTINEIAEEIEKNYAGKKDKNGMPLLPEETELNNNIFANSSYLKDAEPTSECYRQTIYFALNKMITDRLGRPATQKEAAIINQAAIEIGREAPCIYCYSLLDRKAKEAYKLQYLAERESFISALDERYHGDIEAFKKDRANAFDDLFGRYLAREFDPSAKDKKSSGKRKDTAPQRKRLNLWLDLYEAYGKDGDYLTAESVRNPDAEIITRDELYNKYEGNELKLKERELTDIQTWIQDASQAKKVQTYAAYTNAGRGGILNWSQRVINKLNREYGLRWYSHADYHPAFVIDNIQQITDASVRGLKGLMYCKPIEAAKIFAPTGMNINVSCFAKYVNGEYVVDDRLGANWAEVQKLREKYPNVGAVMVCTTEDMTMWALTQDWIDVVIPLHTVRSGSEFVEAFGLHDFSAEQADKLTDEQLYNEFVKKVCEEHDIRSSKGIEAVAKESKSIYPREHQNDYKTYMAALNERGLTARFERIRKMVENGTTEYNGVKVTPEMYMKLVNETRQSDANTKPLAPNFDWDAVRESITQLPEKGYFDYFKDKVEIDGQEMDVNQLADRAAEDIKAGKNPNELGYGETLANPGVVTRQGAKAEGLHGIHHQKKSVDVKFDNATDTEYLSLAEKYRDGTATEDEKGRLRLYLDMAAYGAGYKERVYHGTNKFGFTKIDVSKSDDKISFFAAASPELASTYQRGLTDIATDEVREIGKKSTSTASLEQRIINSLMPTVNGLKDEVDYFIDYAKSAGLSLIDYAYELVDKINNATTLKELKDLPRIANEFEGTYLVDGSLTHREENEFERVERGVRHIGQALREALLFVEDDEKNERGTYEFYANTSGFLEIDCDGANWDEIPLGEIEAEYSEWIRRAADIGSTRSISQYAKHAGYKGVVFYNVVDSAIDNDAEPGDVYAFFKPAEQLKSADPVTYDDNGDIIPLSERFNAENEDIRFQSRNVDVDFFPTGKKERKYSTEGVNAQGRNYAARREADARLAERMHEGAIRARIERKAGETEQAYKERIKKIYEDRYRREIKNTALKWNKKLVDMLARPTENKHVPVQLARSVAEFCEEVTQYLDGTTRRGEKILDKIRKAYDRAFSDEQTILRAKSEDAGYDARGAVLNNSQKDEQLAEMLKELSDITAEKSFAELTRDEMDALLNVVRGVAYAVTEANKMIGEAEGKTVWQTGSTMIEQLENAPKVSAKLRGYLATSLDLRRLARIFSGSNEDAEFVKLVEQLNQGAIEKERISQELQSIFKPVTDKYGDEIKKWYGRRAEWLDTGIVTKDGVPVKITKGMRVSLALHVLNEGNMRHIERGGLTIPEAKLYAQGKLADAYANGKLVRLTAEQINGIIANMTEAEKAYVEAAKQLFHDRAGFYVNKTSLQLAGYTKANVENYFPIHTDKNFNKTDFASMSMDGSIEGQGFLKERVAASNPVYLEDITSVVNRQIRGVALYAGMAIPVRNFNAVMNAAAYEDENGNWVPRATVKQTLAKTMGEYGAKVVEGFVEDASEMSQRVDVTPVERIAGKLATNYVKAVLLGNLKVAMKQVASYPTAAAVIPWKYLNKALVAGGRNRRIISRADVDLINKYTPLYQMRREGNANEVASLMNKPGMEQKLPWLLGWITKMDVMTVGRLWSAAEYMVEDTHKDLTKGSDEFYREVAKVFNQTIQQTQPNFTPLQRSAALRSKNPIVRSLTLFGTQRMQNGGILIEAAYELKQAKGKSAEEIAAARRKLGRAVASQVTQNLLLLFATIAVDALRGRMKSWQDDDDELTLESIGKKMGDTFLSNILGSFLGGSEFYETISNMYKKANGQTTYDTEFSVPALDAIETIMSFGQSGIPNFINYLNGDHTDEEKLNKLKSFSMEMAKVAGYATGLPLENAVKDVFKGFIPAYKDIRDWKKSNELIPWLHQSGKLDSAKTRERYEAWLDAGHKGSEFFAIDKKLKGVTKRDDRAGILWNDDSLAPEDKAMLMEMYDGSNGGYAEGSKFLNKNGKELYDFAAEPAQETETPAETPAEEVTETPATAETPAATEAPAATSAPKSDKYTKAAEKWSPYGVTASQAKTAVEKWEQTGNASEYRAWLSKQNYTGRQKFAMYAQANADTEKKAVDFNKKYGTKFETLWDAYTKYDSNSFHGEEYRAWVEKQTSDYRQRFSLVEFAEPRSNWIEHAEELHKAGVSYKAVWEAARYAKNQSGQGKKDRIIAYAKKLGMTSKQAENIYKWFG